MTKLDFLKSVRNSVERRRALAIGATGCALDARYVDSVRQWEKRNWLMRLFSPCPPSYRFYGIGFGKPCKEAARHIWMKNDMFRGSDSNRRDHILAWLDQEIATLEGGVMFPALPVKLEAARETANATM
jgi:hypothetical protein